LDGTKALSIINTQKVDLVLLDLMMPDISGLEITNLIRKKFLISSLPIIIITAKNQIVDIQNAFELGVNDYIQKPFFKEELIARIKNHLDLKKFNENLEIKVSQRTFELVTARKKIESLNNFVRILNEQKDMKELFLKISEYMYITYKIETSCLFFPNKEKTSIEVFRYYTFNKANPDQINFAEKTKMIIFEENYYLIFFFLRTEILNHCLKITYLKSREKENFKYVTFRPLVDISVCKIFILRSFTLSFCF
jgi:CheY-like chemotaxis protein